MGYRRYGFILLLKIKIMWNIEIIKQVDNYYIVMTPDGETHCIDNTIFELFKKQNRIIGVINKVDI